MRNRLLTALVGCGGLAVAGSGCVVRGYASTPPMQGGGYVASDDPQTYTVQEYPPEPQYEEMTASPGYGYAWIDGNWHWNGYRWVWLSGAWQPQRAGYVYVSPYYDQINGRYVYRAGYWANRGRLPVGVQVYDHRDGRPATYAPPRRDNRYEYRPGVRDHRTDPYSPGGPDVRDHRTSGPGQPYPPGGPDVRDHRDPYRPNGPYQPGGPDVRDHRTPTTPGGGVYQPPVNHGTPGQVTDPRDHRTPTTPGGGIYQPPVNHGTPGQVTDPRDHRTPTAPGGTYRPPVNHGDTGPVRGDVRQPSGGTVRQPVTHGNPGPASGGHDHRDKRPGHY